MSVQNYRGEQALLPACVSGARFLAGARVPYEFSNRGAEELPSENGAAVVYSPALPGAQSVSFAGGFGSETAAQFNAGLDLKIAKGTRLYGDTSYLTGGDADAFRGSDGFIVNW